MKLFENFVFQLTVDLMRQLCGSFNASSVRQLLTQLF